MRPKNDTKRAAKQVMTFFFFGDHPLFTQFLEARTCISTNVFGRPDFVIKIVEKTINLAWCKVPIHCPDFCFSKYGNPIDIYTIKPLLYNIKA